MSGDPRNLKIRYLSLKEEGNSDSYSMDEHRRHDAK